MIRMATKDDVPAVIDMASKFYETTSYNNNIPISIPDIDNLVNMLVDSHILIVSTCENILNGMIGLMIVPFTFNTQYKLATEVVWWVDPKSQNQGVGKELLDGAYRISKVFGADLLQMGKLPTSPAQVDMLYERNGFKHSETFFTKVI